MSGDRLADSTVYIFGQRGLAKKGHIARYYPKGYGVAALCGKSWREGDFAFSFHQPPDMCARCDALARLDRPSADGTADSGAAE